MTDIAEFIKILMLKVIANKGYLIEMGAIESKEVPVDRIKRVLSIGGKLYFKDTLPISLYPMRRVFGLS